jgi:hypothetical protein
MVMPLTLTRVAQWADCQAVLNSSNSSRGLRFRCHVTITLIMLVICNLCCCCLSISITTLLLGVHWISSCRCSASVVLLRAPAPLPWNRVRSIWTVSSSTDREGSSGRPAIFLLLLLQHVGCFIILLLQQLFSMGPLLWLLLLLLVPPGPFS